jgi:peptidoglycan/LPS O-acetylase OafA/YrhL
MFYIIAPLIVPRIGVTVVLFLVAASLNAGFWYAGADPRTWQYQFFPSTLVYFLAGSLAFRLYLLVRHLSYAKAIGYFVVPSMVISGWLLFTPRPDWWWTNNLYVFGYYAACAALIPFLFNTSKNSKIDRFIGDLSYPFYVVHMPVIWMVKSIAGETDIAKIAMVVISLLLALILASAIDRPLDAWRGSKA